MLFRPILLSLLPMMALASGVSHHNKIEYDYMDPSRGYKGDTVERSQAVTSRYPDKHQPPSHSRKKGSGDKKRIKSHHSRKDPVKKHRAPSHKIDHKENTILSPTSEDDYVAQEHATPSPSSKTGHSTDRKRRTPAPSKRRTPAPSSKAGHSDTDRKTSSPTDRSSATEYPTLSPTDTRGSTEAPANGSFDTEYPTLSPTEAYGSIDRDTEAPVEPGVTPSPTVENTLTDIPTPSYLPTITPTAQDTSITVTGDSTIYDVIQQDDDLATLVTLVDTTGMDELLSNNSVALTLFAPVNNALVDTPAYMLTENWRVHLTCILLFHLLPYPATSDVFVDGFSTETMWGEAIYFTRDSANLRSNHIDIYVNGFAFSDNPILESNYAASNGYVHKVRDLMFPTFMTQTLLDVVNGLESLTTLSELVASVGAEDELTAMNRTMFAPTNEAFAAIPSDALSTLTSNPEAVRTVLLYHLCYNVYPDFLLEDGDVLETVLGPTLEISLVNDSPLVNSEASTLQPNVLARNGLLHVIDTVLIPPVEPEDASDVPSDVPSDFPSIGVDPQDIPTISPQPSDLASDLPSDFQSDIPSSVDVEPENVPTMSPSVISDVPSDIPSVITNLDPESIPTMSLQPSTDAAADTPSDVPSLLLVEPEGVPSTAPQASTIPSDIPSSIPVEVESVPSTAPQVSTIPSDIPSSIPAEPQEVPSTDPQASTIPSDIPSISNVEPEAAPTVSPQPTVVASTIPSDVPSLAKGNETIANVTALNTTSRQDEVSGEPESGAASWSNGSLLLWACVSFLFG
ncbi:hypothetical protein FisN_28Hh072 [Fistulifera solaris]|uniref:FAS1 domain-containing protein n=1 Tax=Fistulifera solaris TaxID=1519565 RepID=A0A1Z5KGZ6_FISSO|nr:hypothetical protein FisN_28Hh072 [Fistulifera solaris]|eukprot:GAX25600.1 hypothetical protein FisN_28Hh072 [Fistulifera solaris]